MVLSIVIVSWNTRDLLAACLDSVYAHPPQAAFEVWVVDNRSTDGTLPMLHQRFPQVQLIENDENVGFATANNQAIAVSEGRYVLLLNPDTELKEGALQALVDFMDAKSQAGAAGSLLLNPDGSLQVSCYPMPTLLRELWRMLHLDKIRPFGQYDMFSWNREQPQEVDVLQGASLMLRRSVLDVIGYLDAGYFMYTEEVDLCYRLMRAGWQLYWVPQSKVVHYGGQSTRQVAEKMFLQLYRSKIQFFRKHYGVLPARIYKGVLFLTAVPRILLAAGAYVQAGEARSEKVRLSQYYRKLVAELPQM